MIYQHITERLKENDLCLLKILPPNIENDPVVFSETQFLTDVAARVRRLRSEATCVTTTLDHYDPPRRNEQRSNCGGLDGLAHSMKSSSEEQ